MTTQQVITAQHEQIDEALDELQQETEKSSRKAEGALLTWLLAALVVKNGVIQRSPANVRAARAIPKRFNALMSRNGFDAAIAKFLVTMTDQTDVFGEILAQSLHTKMPEFTAQQVAYLQELKEQATLALITEADDVGRRFMAGVLNFMGQPTGDLSESLGDLGAALPARVREVAETAVTTYFRTIADIGYGIVAKQHPDLKLRFTYAGPRDERNRPFCARLKARVANGQTWTREEIDSMDNGQIGNVFITCGGYGCRHQWLGQATL